MSTTRRRKSKLQVSSESNVRYIEVPSNDAGPLRDYLRRHGLHVSPPGPCSANVDTLQLQGTISTELIQGLLDRWK
jgi:hypothetical protein